KVDAEPALRQGDGRSQPGEPRADNHYALDTGSPWTLRDCHHAPPAMTTFRQVGTLTRREKTSYFSATMRSSMPRSIWRIAPRHGRLWGSTMGTSGAARS